MCNTLQHTATHCITLQHIATHCSTLQHTATHRNTLQHTATHRNSPEHSRSRSHTHTLTLSHSHSQTLTLTLSPLHSHTVTLSPHNHTLTLSHSHTLTLTLSHSPSNRREIGRSVVRGCRILDHLLQRYFSYLHVSFYINRAHFDMCRSLLFVGAGSSIIYCNGTFRYWKVLSTCVTRKGLFFRKKLQWHFPLFIAMALSVIYCNGTFRCFQRASHEKGFFSISRDFLTCVGLFCSWVQDPRSFIAMALFTFVCFFSCVSHEKGCFLFVGPF